MTIRVPSLLASLLTLSLASCGCADVGLAQVTPNDRTLRVGESVTLVYETGGACMVKNQATDVELHTATTIWCSADTLIVVLDTMTGRVTGRSPGEAWVVSGGGSGARIHVLQ
jgi:hypothetical protein